MDSKQLKTLAATVASHFVAVRDESANVSEARKERVGLILATIKRDAPTMEHGEQVNVVYAFGVECSKAGMSPSTIAVRKSEFLFLLEHSALIEDAANAWRPTVDRIRKSLKSARDILTADIAAATEALAKAQARLDELNADWAGMIGCEEAGLL